jgi:hypothetical protein
MAHAYVALLCGLVFGSGACVSGTHIYIKSIEQTNEGKTLYALVRSVDAKGVASERYQDVSAKVFADPPDASVLVSRPVFPGNPVTLTVPDGDAKELVIYFLFTNPGLNWRLPLHAPLPSEVYIDLGTNQIERVQLRKR